MAYEMDLINYLTALHLAGIVSEEDFRSEVKTLTARLPHTRENWRAIYSDFVESMGLFPDGPDQYEVIRHIKEKAGDIHFGNLNLKHDVENDDNYKFQYFASRYLLENFVSKQRYYESGSYDYDRFREIEKKQSELEGKMKQVVDSVSALVSAVNQSNLTRTAVEAAPRSSSNAKRIAQIRKEISSKISLLGGFAERGDLGKLEMYKADITLLESELRELGA